MIWLTRSWLTWSEAFIVDWYWEVAIRMIFL
jgi:hypothetical protein